MKRLPGKLIVSALLALALLCVSHAVYLEREAWRFKALPFHDFIPEAERLRAQGRLSEACSVLDFVIANPELPRQEEARTLRDEVRTEMGSWLARARRLGRGMLTGSGRNAEEIIGAISADMFVIGDVRDIAIQAWRYAAGGETDTVVVALSTIGLATVLIPEIDWAPAFLKVARKTGSMTRRFGEFLIDLARTTKQTRSGAKAVECLRDTSTLVRRLGPSGALDVMRCVESERNLKTVAHFAECARGAAYPALATGGRDALRILEKDGVEKGAEMVVEAAKRGPRGVAVATQMSRNLFRAHFCVGAAKSFWKGNLREAITLALSRLGRGKLLALWLALALALSAALTWTMAPLVRWCTARTRK